MDIKLQQNNITLKQFQFTEAQQLFDLINSNREHLGQWLGWVKNTQSVADIETFIQNEREKLIKMALMISTYIKSILPTPQKI